MPVYQVEATQVLLMVTMVLGSESFIKKQN